MKVAQYKTMIRQCAWCSKIMGETIPLEDKRSTHTICLECVAVHFPDFLDEAKRIEQAETQKTNQTK